MDRLLDNARTGPFHLRDPQIAEMVIDALRHATATLRHFELHAFVVMPNHVHMLITPQVPIPTLMKSLKSITAKRANEVLGMTGKPFWQDESFDRNVRNREELSRILRYIEMNPVTAGLVHKPREWLWSSAAEAIRGSPADQGVRPPNA
jgi:putative DNA methylase